LYVMRVRSMAVYIGPVGMARVEYDDGL